ncbi:uncharacterized protein [Antedon mediterranea]|uniref:uncharacterized protein isoform X2 n=1 Tax=Antedon mediterranea TaxID=105859 RepID=UPI003AF75014
MAGANIGLSRLSRGVGEEKKIKGHRKLAVSLEPEDYYNLHAKKFFLPPIQQSAWQNENILNREMLTHKTFTTRKGALLLYAEDLASIGEDGNGDVKRKKALEAEDTNLFSSTNDFCSAILSYGAKGNDSSPVFLNFVKARNKLGPRRSVRPGFSAKRYMANWSRSWDDSILNKLRTNGDIWDKNLFQPNAANPHIYRRINDDLSQYPSPYHVTRSMLLSPGDVQQYEFYRIRSNDDIPEEKEDSVHSGQSVPLDERLVNTATIAVVTRDKDNKPHLVSYKDLDGDKQTAVLQRLLVQSVINQHQSIDDLLERMSSVSTKSESGSVLQSPLVLDLEQAIVDLVTSNSNQLQSGNQVFPALSPTQKDSMLEPTLNSAIGQYIPLPPITSPIPAIRPLMKKKPLGGRSGKLPALPSTSQSLSSGSYSLVDSEESQQWQGNTQEENNNIKGRLGKLGNLKSSSNNSLNKVPASDVDLTLKLSNNIDGSLENLAMNQVQGGFMPKWQEKSMRSYKSSLKSSSGSVVMGPDGDILAIGGSYVQSLASASEYGNDDVIEDDVIRNQEDAMSKSESIHPPSVATDDKQEDQDDLSDVVSSQNDSAESLKNLETAQDRASSGGNSVTEAVAMVVDGGELEHAVTENDGGLGKENALDETTGDVEDEQKQEEDLDVNTTEGSVPKEWKEQEENEEEGKKLLDSSENKPEQRASEQGQDQNTDEQQPPDAQDMGNEEEEVHVSDDNRSVVSAASVMEDIMGQALKVAESVIQRPQSGRDLAADAKAAASMWAEQLKEMFCENEIKLERSTSAGLQLTNNALLTQSSDVDYWVKQSSKVNKDKNKFRVHSAEAAITTIKNIISNKNPNSIKDDTIANAITEDAEKKIDGTGDAPPTKLPKKSSAKLSASAHSTLSGKRLPEETSLEFDVTSYQGVQKEKLPVKEDGKDEDDDTQAFKDAIDKIVNETGLLEKDKKGKKQKKTKKQTTVSPESDKSIKEEQQDERERFIVGKPKEPKKPDALGFKKQKNKKVVKKEKKKVIDKKPVKGKKKTITSDKDKTIETEKVESPKLEKEAEEAPANDVQSTKEEEVVGHSLTPDMMSIDQSMSGKSSESPESPQFIIIHDPIALRDDTKSSSTIDDNMSDVMSSITEDSTIQGPQSVQSIQSISRSQAKQAKRAAEAERRKQEVEIKRKKREEAKRKSLEEVERKERMKREFEEEKLRKEEEIRLRKEKEIEEKQRQEAALLAKKRQAQLALEKEKKQREERQRKMEEIARKKRAEELKRKEEEEIKRKEEEERRKAEQEMLEAMAEEERLEYERKKQEEERLQREREEQERIQREEQARKAQQEAERLMQLKLKEQKELELRLQFNRLLQSESNILAHSQDMTRAFTFSYYELLEALGIEAPDWLKKELEQYSDS